MKLKAHNSVYKASAIALGVAGFASGIHGSIIPCAIFTAASGSIYMARVRAKHKTGAEADSYGFVKAMLSSYRKNGGMGRALLDGSAAMPNAAVAIKKRLERYSLGDRSAFLHGLSGSEGSTASSLGGIINKALSTGDDVKMELSDLANGLQAQMRDKIGRAGQVGNARFVSLLGIVLFFPLFAGISSGILASASQINRLGHLGLLSVGVVFASFIAMECFMHFRWEAGSAIDRACSAVLCSSFGMLVLKASSMFAISAI